MTKRTSTEEVVAIAAVAATFGAVSSPVVAQIERYKNKKKGR